MKSLCLLLITISANCFGQTKLATTSLQKSPDHYVRSIDNLTLEAALELISRATKAASLLNKKVAIAVLDASGSVLLISRDNSVGPIMPMLPEEKLSRLYQPKHPHGFC